MPHLKFCSSRLHGREQGEKQIYGVNWGTDGGHCQVYDSDKLNGTVIKACFVLFFSRIGLTKNIINKNSTDQNNRQDL